MKNQTLWLTALAGMLIASPAAAFDVPNTMHFQAFLTDEGGETVTGNVSAVFRFTTDRPAARCCGRKLRMLMSRTDSLSRA